VSLIPESSIYLDNFRFGKTFAVNNPSNVITVEEKVVRFQKENEDVQLPIADGIIAATTSSLSLSLATLNKKHFTDIDGLQLLTPDSFE
jgi:hypothetical protein